MPKSRTTLRDIAKVLNVSVTTVSRALNDREDISPAMKTRVVETARLLEYKPNALARSLRNNTSSKLIGVIIPELDHYFYSTIMKGITMSQEDEYCVIIGESNHDPLREVELIDQYIDHFVAGLVVVPSRDTRSFSNVQELKTKGVPFIILDRTFDGYEGSYIRYDDYEGARMATKHLIAQGKKRIGLLQGDKDCSISSNRYKGYIDALKEHDIEIDNTLVKRCPEASKKEAFEACQKLWDHSTPPDAIFTITDQLAAGVYNFAHEHNIKIPLDLAVVGYSNSEISDILYPSLTTVNQNGQHLGQMARQHIIQEIETSGAPLQKTISTELIIRKSSQL